MAYNRYFIGLFVSLVLIMPSHSYIHLPNARIRDRAVVSSPRISERYAAHDDFDISPGLESGKVDSKEVPSIKALLKFGLPTLAIWLLQPILSIIDTSVVGISSAANDVSKIAALSPGISWIDGTANLAQAFGIVLTNKYAKALAEKDAVGAERVLSHFLLGSVVGGVLLGNLQHQFAGDAITAVASKSPAVIPYAVEYARLRSFGAAFAVPTMVLQAACLARRDSLTPLRAVLVGGLVNIIGDIYLVMGCGWGLAGAAMATALSQAASASYLVWSAFQMLPTKNGAVTVADRCKQILDKISLPRLQEVKDYAAFVVPILFIMASRVALWQSTSVACASLGAVNLAAHQISLNLLWFCTTFGEAYTLMSQTFLPALFFRNSISSPPMDISSKDSVDLDSSSAGNEALGASARRSANFFIVLRRIASISVIFNAMNSIGGYSLNTFGTQMFTTSAEVGGLMKQLAPWLLLCTLPHGLMCALEGFLIVARDSTFHTSTYFVTGGAFLSFLAYVRRQSASVVTLWKGFAVFQWTRATLFVARSLYLSGKFARAEES